MDYYEVKARLSEICAPFKLASPKECGHFSSIYDGSGNFMTNNRHATLSLEGGRYIAEVSFGSGLNAGTYIFGVTVIERNEAGQWGRSELSRCCTSLADLHTYLESLDSEEVED